VWRRRPGGRPHHPCPGLGLSRAAGIPTRTAEPIAGRDGIDVAALVAEARAGRPRAVARLISLVEDDHPRLREVMATLAPHTGHAHVVGVTGAPGVGKSTSTNALVAAMRAAGHRVGVLAVDPSSPFSGGALLGDRVRMQEHTTDPEVYIRSMASRGHLGGLAWATPQALRVLDGAGCDVVVVETVGVGQSEVEVAGLADTTVVLLAPGMGDGIQAAKAGILEVGDVFVVNKADRPGSQQTVRDLRTMVDLATAGDPGRWVPPVIPTVATTGEGVAAVAEAIDAHLGRLVASGGLRERRVRRAAAEITALALAELRSRMGGVGDGAQVRGLAEAVVDGTTDPYAAADAVVAGLT
jgi:LAO/AO transport system kinase